MGVCCLSDLPRNTRGLIITSVMLKSSCFSRNHVNAQGEVLNIKTYLNMHNILAILIEFFLVAVLFLIIIDYVTRKL